MKHNLFSLGKGRKFENDENGCKNGKDEDAQNSE